MDKPGSKTVEPVRWESKDPVGGKWADPELNPKDYVPPKPTYLDHMIAGEMNEEDLTQSIIEEAYGPLRQYCVLPESFNSKVLDYEFRHIYRMTEAELDDLSAHPPSKIIDPQEPQMAAIKVLRRFLRKDPTVCHAEDPFQPKVGVNLVGKPGCGKTHILTAFAALMKMFLDARLQEFHTRVRQFVRREYIAYQLAIMQRPNPNAPETIYKIDADGKGDEEKAPATVFLDKLEQLKQALAKLPYQPPDLLYLNLDTLWELCHVEGEKRDQALHAIMRAKLLFIDDVRPKGNPDRIKLVIDILEGRHAAGHMGNFMTTNLTTEELAGGDAHILEPLKSRCNEMMCQIDFVDCRDWRTEINSRRIRLLMEGVMIEIAEELGISQRNNPLSKHTI